MEADHEQTLTSAGWQSLGNVNYRKWVVYNDLPCNFSSFDCDTAKSNHFVSICPNGGPLAVLEKNPSYGVSDGVVPTRDAGKIISMCGKVLGTLCHKGLDIATGGFGWLENPRELLLVIYVSGEMDIIDISGETKETVFLLSQFMKEKVEKVSIYAGGCILLLGSGKVMRVSVLAREYSDAIEIETRFLNNGSSIIDTNESSSQLFITMAAQKHSLLVAVNEAEIWVIDESTCIPRKLSGLNGRIVRIAICPNFRFVACFVEDGWLVVYSTSFSKKVLEFDTKSRIAPVHMAWCGEDSVVMYWKQLGLLMVGPYGDWVKYTYNENLIIVQEIDCLRIASHDTVEILQRVPDCTDLICRIGSFAPAAMLVDAIDAMDSGDPKADENIRAVKEEGTLVEAVRDCINAACSEFEISHQKLLLRAAVLGKTFCDFHQDQDGMSEQFLNACNSLRTLNVLRHPSIGIPLTVTQYDCMSSMQLIQRLISRKHHFLAQKLCKYLRLPLSAERKILEHWACKKLEERLQMPVSVIGSDKEIQNTDSTLHVRDVPQQNRNMSNEDRLIDESLFTLIRSKLDPCRGVSYSKVALTAEYYGWKNMCRLLLEAETVVIRKVLTLISLDEFELALKSAVKSRDFNLMFFVLMYIWKKEGDSGEGSNTVTFFSLIKQFPELCQQFISYCKIYDRQTLKDCYYQLGRLQDAASLLVLDAYGALDINKRLEKLGFALEMYRNNRAYSFQAKMTEQQLKLIEFQLVLEKTTGETCFVNKSLLDTIYTCLMLGLGEEAEKARYNFKPSEGSFYRTKIKALCKLEAWDQLRTFAAENRSPIGYRPFAEACLESENRIEAEHYCRLVTAPDEQLSLYVQLEDWGKCVPLVIKLGDVSTAAVILSRCTDSRVTGELKQYFN